MDSAELPFNILIGPLYNTDLIGRYLQHPRVKAFMSHDTHQDPDRFVFTYDIEKDSFADLLGRLPPDWQPDLLIWWDLIYQAIPPGIADCPFPTAVVVGDWNIHFFATRQYIHAFDYVFCDRKLERVLNQLGVSKVAYWPGFYFEQDKHFIMPETEILYDISFVGNLNHRVQRQRGAYLERIALMSERWRVRIDGGVYGEDYTRLLNQSRIVFNHSICQGMNMRAYEVPACGALLFLEDDNLEVRDILTDRESCVLYNQDNLEALLEYYLSHEDERAALAARGHEVIQAYSYEKQFGRLIGLLPAVREDFAGPGQRGFHALTPLQQQLTIARQLFRANTPGAMQAAVRLLTDYGRVEQPDRRLETIAPELLNQLGKFLFDPLADVYQHADPQIRDHARISLDQAIGFFTAAQSQRPRQPMLAYNLAWCHDLNDDYARAGALYRETLQLLAAGEPLDPWYEPVQPGNYNQRFGIEWDRREIEAILASEPPHAGQERLLAWRIHERLGHFCLQAQDWSGAEAAYRSALAACPEFGETDLYLGNALFKQKKYDATIEAWLQAIQKQPFMLPLWLELARLLLHCRAFGQAATLLSDWRRIVKVNARLHEHDDELAELQRLARAGQALSHQPLDVPALVSALAGPYSLRVQQELQTWAERGDLPVPPALSVSLLLRWQPPCPEAMCTLPPQTGFRFASQAQAGAFGIAIGAEAAPPLAWRRSYLQASDLDQGVLGPDRLPIFFPSLELSEAVELEEQRAVNLLLIAARLDAREVITALQSYLQVADDAAVLFLWKPAGEPDEAELASLESALGESEASVSLIQEDFTPSQQGRLLQNMRLVLTDASECAGFYSAWCRALGVPALACADAGEADFRRALREPGSEQDADALAQWQEEQQACGPKVLDLCWDLRLKLLAASAQASS